MLDSNNPVDAGRSIRTYTGRYVDLWDLKDGDIVIEDIAHALSNLCRYGGHIPEFYSVAEHSCEVASSVWFVDKTAALEGLLHDASEAYLVDIPRPIKHSPDFESYRQLEATLEQHIAKVFGLVYPMPPVVKKFDQNMLAFEWRMYVVDPTPGLTHLSPKEAKEKFLLYFETLVNERGVYAL